MYHVGQILYVILKKQMQVIPFRVVEEISRKTLQGNIVSYIVECGAEPGVTLELSKVDGEVFASIDDVKQSLIDRAMRTVEKLVIVASEKSKSWYGETEQSLSVSAEQTNTVDVTDNQQEVAIVTLSDGTKAKAKIRM